MKTFKKQERKKNKLLSRDEFFKLFRPKLTTYLKEKSPLEWLGKFIESLPQRDGCFQFPLVKLKPFEICPGKFPLLTLGKSLKFKVDLTPNDQSFGSQIGENSPSQPLRNHPRYTQSYKKNKSKNKKLKTEFLSSKKTQRPSKDQTFELSEDLPLPIFIESQSVSEDLKVKREAPTHQITPFGFHPSERTPTNFKLQSDHAANFSRALFNQMSGSEVSETTEQRITDKAKVSELTKQLDCIELGDSPKKSARLNYENLGVVSQNSIMVKKEDLSISEADQSVLDHSSIEIGALSGQETISELIDARIQTENEKKRIQQKVNEMERKKEELLKGISQLDKDIEGLDKAIIEKLMEQHRESKKEKARKDFK